jgi:hypothetical protein
MAGRKTSGKGAKNAKGDASIDPGKLSAVMMTLMKAVAEKGSPRRNDEFYAKLAPPDALVFSSPGFAAAALALAADLSLFTAPPGRSTAVERLVKTAKPPAGSLEAAALEALAAHRFALFEIVDVADDGAHQARDLLSGEAFTLTTFGMELIGDPGERLAGRLAPTADGRFLLSACAVLHDMDLEMIRPWLTRDGRAMANPARCAEALYHRAVGMGEILLPGVYGYQDADDDEDAPPEDRLHTIATAWAVGVDASVREDDEQTVRQRVSVDDIILVLQWVRVGRIAGDQPWAAACERMAVLQLETLRRRAGAGNKAATETLKALEREIDRAVAAREIPPLYRALYQELSRRAAQAIGTGGDAGDKDRDLDKLRARIQALRAKTVDQGCTEEETLAAAAKVAELLDRHGLSLSELDMRRQTCEGAAIETGRRRRAPIDDCVATVAAFCDCRHWIETDAAGELRFIFFGLPGDVAGARCLYDMVAAALAGETAAFKSGPLYAEHPSAQRASATRSFQIGMIDSIVGKLLDLKELRTRTGISRSGRDLVPVKADIVADELARLGMRFTAKATARRSVLKDAFHAGRIAGETFEVDQKLDRNGA